MENKSIRNFNLEEFYESCTDHFPNHKPRPVIGITGNFGEKGCELGEGYYKSIERAGGIPLVIPPTENAEILLSLLDKIDGLLLSGGADINPLFMGEEPMPSLGFINHKRDRSELLLIRLATTGKFQSWEFVGEYKPSPLLLAEKYVRICQLACLKTK